MADPLAADVAVVGGGPAGVAAAAVAAEAGKRVLLLEEGARPGGQIWRHRPGGIPPKARRWLERLTRSGAVRLGAASAYAVSDSLTLSAETEAGPIAVSAKALVLATGARERFLPFPGWTLPNVIGVGGAQALLKSGVSFSGRRVVIAGSGPLLLPVAASLARGGAGVALVAEQAPAGSVFRFAAGLAGHPGLLAEAVAYRRAFLRTPYRFGTWAVEARGTDRVEEVVMTDGKKTWTERCDVLCTGFGLVPATELARLIGCRIEGGAVAVDGLQRTSVAGVFCAGEASGIGGVEKALAEGQVAGCAAADRSPRAGRIAAGRRGRRHAAALSRAFGLREELRALARPDTIVCRCEDVPASAVAGMGSAREAKLATRAGMGPCQGRVCGPALRYLFGWESDTVRVPISPVSIGTLAAIDAGAPQSKEGE
ncbi:MAG TPA: FAD/NAD(P)-binding oxidoreductase [Thermoanaerobaculia bacterium]|nr:FAD/NAD(P)-binding oxidoreductase [Thermoanaerobaculia bacterium]